MPTCPKSSEGGEEERAEGKCCVDRDWGNWGDERERERESGVINSETSSKGLTSWGSQRSEESIPSTERQRDFI